MSRSINYEALISPVLRTPTRYGVRPAFEVLVRDLTGGAPIRFARYVQVYSTDVPAAEMRERARAALRTAYGARSVSTLQEAVWGRVFRFVFDEGDPDTAITPAELPLIEPGDLAA